MSPSGKLFFSILLSCLLLIPLKLVLGNSQTVPPPAKTGAPGDGTCAECHTGPSNNPGKVVLDFGPLAYTRA